MTLDTDAARARRYLLGQATEEERAAVEQEYFDGEEAIDRMEAAEEDLIEDYLSFRLSQSERSLFEREYLAAPHHRQRVETVRQLVAAASRAAPGRTARHPYRWLPLAAALLLGVGGSLWMLSSSRLERQAPADNRAPAASIPAEPVSPGIASDPPTASPRVFAVTISPMSVRSGAENSSLVIPAGTDMLSVNLEAEPDGRSLIPSSASIRTVSGAEVWRGPVAADATLRPGVRARIDVPVAQLPAEDYVVTLFGTDSAGVNQEQSRYFLRVRAR